jgi:hypothetical protein
LKRFDEAASEFSRASEASSGQYEKAQYNLLRVNCLLESGNTDAAVKEFQTNQNQFGKVISGLQRAEVHDFVAEKLLATKRPQKADEELKKGKQLRAEVLGERHPSTISPRSLKQLRLVPK